MRLVPAKPGLQLDAVGSAQAVLHAALRRRPRVAQLVVAEEPAKLTTAQAETMGIDALVSSYTTIYGGVPNRIHNVQLVAHLVNDKLIAPGETFSFNKTTGERNAAKGFLVAPVIVNGELTTGLGGGVCQVSTTVFNAAFEAGIPITARTNHALYISHYPQGRDATVDYPDVDLKFVNDTKHWLLLRTFVGSLVAHGQPVRHADGAQGREHDEPARRSRQDAGEEDGRSHAQAGREGDRRSGRAVDVDQRHPRRVRPGRQAPLPQRLVLVLPRLARASARRAEEEAPEGEDARAGYDDDGDDAVDSAERIAVTSQSGTRVGRNVAASTQACAVQPSASSSPSSRTMAYS